VMTTPIAATNAVAWVVSIPRPLSLRAPTVGALFPLYALPVFRAWGRMCRLSLSCMGYARGPVRCCHTVAHGDHCVVDGDHCVAYSGH